MAIRALKKILLGFSIGVLFIVLSGLLTGGVVFADFLLSLNFANSFMIFGIPYGFVAGLIYLLFLKFKGKENIIKMGAFFGIGFWLSFSVLYIIMYFAFSRFQGL